MASTIDAFRAKVNKQGLAKTNKYYVSFRPPFSSSITEQLNLYCSAVNLAGRNLKNIEIVSPLGINPYNLMRYENVVIDSKVMDKIQGMTS